MTGKDTAWLFGGLALIALSLGMIFLIPYQSVTTAPIQDDQSPGSNGLPSAPQNK